MAEAVFADVVKKAGLSDTIIADSFGTSAFHIGESPDRRSAATCEKHGVPINHSAQQIFPNHFSKFDYIIAMDRSNLQNLESLKPKNNKAKVQLFGDYKGTTNFDRIVNDPYYGGDAGFEINFQQVLAFSKNLLESIKTDHF